MDYISISFWRLLPLWVISSFYFLLLQDPDAAKRLVVVVVDANNPMPQHTFSLTDSVLLFLHLPIFPIVCAFKVRKLSYKQFRYRRSPFLPFYRGYERTHNHRHHHQTTHGLTVKALPKWSGAKVLGSRLSHSLLSSTQ